MITQEAERVAVKEGPARTGDWEHEETRALVALVHDAAELLRARGAGAFAELREEGSRWRQGESYVFVLDMDGNMLVHPDTELEGKNQLELKDIDGRPIIRGLIDACTALSSKPSGWFHYLWPVPGGILPRWKSSYVCVVHDPSGEHFVVGSGMYNDRMEKSFVADLVDEAVGQIEAQGRGAFLLFRDPIGRFRVKDAYVFVYDPYGMSLVNAAFPTLEGSDLLQLKDTRGKELVREMLDVVQTHGAGWVDYMWPPPGASVSTQKSAYVRRAQLGNDWVLVGCGVYLADAPREAPPPGKLKAPELVALVREAAALVEEKGADAFPVLRAEASKWHHDDVYFFAWTLDGRRTLHVAEPTLEGQDAHAAHDLLGRPVGKMILDVAAKPSGEGWVHYMHTQPGQLFPTWKSSFVKRVKLPNGEQQLLGSGVYNLERDEPFIEGVVQQAASLIEEQGTAAFSTLRDRNGPFFFADTYVFVVRDDGTEVVNPAQPSFEGRSLLDLRDLRGRSVVQEEIDLCRREESGWLELTWYRPGDNVEAEKRTFVRRVLLDEGTFIVGSGIYADR